MTDLQLEMDPGYWWDVYLSMLSQKTTTAKALLIKTNDFLTKEQKDKSVYNTHVNC